ncbi:hypothetical protein P3T73_06070 [Kiritimatiellota bacterium B12222]|nr:hypothetical protein P3T73_06070 [Kiritimatiellota bacterium B12222]
MNFYRIKHGRFITGLLVLLSFIRAYAGIYIHDSIFITDEKQRDAIISATEKLDKTPTDIQALETLVHALGPHVSQSPYYTFEDPVKKKAYVVMGEMYSTEFLLHLLNEGSNATIYWSLQKIKHQEINSYEGWKSGRRQISTAPRMISRNALVTPEVKRALIPHLNKLKNSPEKGITGIANRMIKEYGLLMDREGFLNQLNDPDEEKVAKSLSNMMAYVRVDPLITERVWELLADAETDYLRFTCLRYPWLFEIEQFDEPKEQTLLYQLEYYRGGVATNVNTALEILARSENPLAEEILQSLTRSHNVKAKIRAERYLRVYDEKNRPSEEAAELKEAKGASLRNETP